MSPPTAGSDHPVPAASLARRMASLFYDSLLLFAIAWAVTATVVSLRVVATGHTLASVTEQTSTVVSLLRILWLLAFFLFYGWFWTRTGQTLGMQAWRIRVESVDGSPINWHQAAARFAGAAVSWLCLGAGFWWMLFEREGRTWHDRWSRSRVILVAKSGAQPVV